MGIAIRPRQSLPSAVRNGPRKESRRSFGNRSERPQPSDDRWRRGETMKSASVAEVKTHFSSYLKDSEKSPVVVTRNGRPIAMLVAVTDEDEVERLMMADSPQLQAILDAAHQRIQDGGGMPAKEF